MERRSAADAAAAALRRPLVPVGYERLLLEILEERGIGRAESLRKAGIDPSDIERANARVSLEQCVRLVMHARRATDDEGLGYELGLRLKPSVHGVLGFAAMTSASLSEALAVASKYIRARFPQLQLVVGRDAETAVVELRETFSIPILREFFFECVLVGFAHTATLICENRPPVEIWFDWPEPAYHARYQPRLPRIRFERPANQIRFPATFLETRLLFADEHAHRNALAQVEREEWFAGDEPDFLMRVRAALRASPGAYASLPAVAKHLGVSPRTLRRKLSSEGMNYRRLLDEVRYRDARHLLEMSDLDLSEISARLGFDSPPGFTRAFKQWAKTTPSDYRAGLRDRR